MILTFRASCDIHVPSQLRYSRSEPFACRRGQLRYSRSGSVAYSHVTACVDADATAAACAGDRYKLRVIRERDVLMQTNNIPSKIVILLLQLLASAAAG